MGFLMHFRPFSVRKKIRFFSDFADFWDFLTVFFYDLLNIGLLPLPLKPPNAHTIHIDIKYTRHTIHKIYNTQVIQYTRYTIHKIYNTQDIQYTKTYNTQRHKIHKIYNTQDIQYTRYTIYKIYNTQDIQYTRYTIHKIYNIQERISCGVQISLLNCKAISDPISSDFFPSVSRTFGFWNIATKYKNISNHFRPLLIDHYW